MTPVTHEFMPFSSCWIQRFSSSDRARSVLPMPQTGGSAGIGASGSAGKPSSGTIHRHPWSFAHFIKAYATGRWDHIGKGISQMKIAIFGSWDAYTRAGNFGFFA